ncbi:MAG: 3-oxoacyl-ACP reductase family protein [Ruminococcus sp.]|nr:3-oxoacyl-ACP reductase family protein [Ruminococcus sp.]
MDIFTIKDRVAVVTGATRGIGRVIAIKLAEAGAKVAVLGRDEKKANNVKAEIEKLGGKAEVFLGDISDDKECKRIADEVNARFGQLDILVNCAGALTSTKVDDISRAEWDKILGVNLTGTFFMIQSALPYLRKSKAGRIINISSNAGRMGGYANSQSYTASKGGVIAITKGIARQLAPDNITVNVVCPGTTRTEMSELYDEETTKRLIGRIPLGRLGKPEDTAAAVCFFASEEAGFITGAVLDVNGGMYM